VRIEEIKTLDAFLEKTQKYIAYEEKQMAVGTSKPKRRKKLKPLDEEMRKRKKKRCENLNLHRADLQTI
jgi:hypothetical protein